MEKPGGLGPPVPVDTPHKDLDFFFWGFVAYWVLSNVTLVCAYVSRVGCVCVCVRDRKSVV